MRHLQRARSPYWLSLVMCFLLIAAMAVPAMAAGKPAGGKSEQAQAAQSRNAERKASKPAKAERAPASKPAKSQSTGGASSPAVTEDNDTNDGGTANNVVDDGDNMHPSGKDKSVENGNSGNQGNSTSDPDHDGRGPDRSNGGADKPDGPGGVDLADQDGNNGCGNDDDFEDDNEGWCGRKPKPAKAEPTDDVAPVTDTCEDGTIAGTTSCEPAEQPCTGEMADSAECAPAPCEVEMDAAGTCGESTCDEDMGDVTAAGCEPVAAPDSDVESEDEGVLGIQGQAPGIEDSTFQRFLGDAGAPAGLVAAIGGTQDALAATGAPTIVLALLALSGLGLGTGLVRRTRRR